MVVVRTQSVKSIRNASGQFSECKWIILGVWPLPELGSRAVLGNWKSTLSAVGMVGFTAVPRWMWRWRIDLRDIRCTEMNSAEACGLDLERRYFTWNMITFKWRQKTLNVFCELSRWEIIVENHFPWRNSSRNFCTGSFKKASKIYSKILFRDFFSFSWISSEIHPEILLVFRQKLLQRFLQKISQGFFKKFYHECFWRFPWEIFQEFFHWYF